MKHCHLARLYCTFKSAASFGILSIVFLSNRVTYYSSIRLSFYLFKQTNELQKITCIFVCVYIYIYKRCYLYNIFTTNYRWLVVIGSNLKLILNYIFAPTITTSNNLSLRICCKNVVDISFLSLSLYIYKDVFKLHLV